MRIQRLAGLLLAAAVPFGAQAAPQMLGLARTVGLTPLHCAGGECTAELTAFCLQQERDMPRAGTVYAPVDGRRITLHFTAADGSVTTMPAGDLARITTARGQFAVRLAVPAARVREMGARRVAVSVGARVALVPEPVPGDSHPLTTNEIGVDDCIQYTNGEADLVRDDRLVDQGWRMAARAGVPVQDAMPEDSCAKVGTGAREGHGRFRHRIGAS